MTPYNAGGMISGASGVTAVSRGRCPLDGYLLAEIDCPVEPGWDHIIPLADFADGLRRIAEAHGFEASAAAEQIARDA